MRTEQAAFAALVALAATPAVAETSPFYIGVTGTVSRDSNVFRTDAPESDTIYSAGIRAGFDQPIGRQRVFGDASVAENRFGRLSRLDNRSYGLSTGIDWATIDNTTGTLRYATNRGLADYGLANATLTTDKNILTTQQFVGSASHALPYKFSIAGNVEHRSVDYTADAYRSQVYSENVYGAGAHYLVNPDLDISLGARATRGRTPQYVVAPEVFEPDRLDRNDIDISAALSTAQTTLSARLSRTHTTHTLSIVPGFSGYTGAVDLTYRATAKLKLYAVASRDTGSGTTFLRFGLGGININTSQLSTQAQVSANYALSAKIEIASQAKFARGRTSSEFGSTTDRTQAYSLQASWDPLRSLRMSCNVAHESRRSTTVGLDESATVAACSAAFTLY